MKCLLSDIVDVTMGQSPKSEFYNSKGEGMPFLQGNRTFGRRYPIFDTYTTCITKKAQAGDLIMSVRAPVGDLNITPVDLCLGRGVCGLRMKNGNQSYLFYLLKYYMPHLINKESGTVFGSVNRNDINGLVVDVSDDPLIQQRIARTLEMIDDKIECNEKINKNLQEQLLTLYKNMIMDADAENTKELDDMCEFHEGYVNPPQGSSEYFDGEIKWLRAVDINESFIIDTSRTLTNEGYESAKKSAYLFKPNTIAISKSGTIGRLGILADYMCGNRAVINIAPKNTEHLPLIYGFLKSRQSEFENLAVGSVQKNLYISLLAPLKINLPSYECVDTFCAMANDLLLSMLNNCQENKNLVQLRDNLLPRLMSGEIDVSNVEI